MDVIMRTVYEKLIALFWRLAVPLYIGERKGPNHTLTVELNITFSGLYRCVFRCFIS